MLRVPARRVKGWRLEHKRVIDYQVAEGSTYPVKKMRGDFWFTPPLPDQATLRKRLGPRETITLVPYGCAKLRIAIFPRGA